MTPKEKAIELISKYFKILAKSSGYKGLKTVEDTHKFGKLEQISISCAIIAVDEILKYQNIILEQFPSDGYKPNYWQEVKQELDNKI